MVGEDYKIVHARLSDSSPIRFCASYDHLLVQTLGDFERPSWCLSDACNFAAKTRLVCYHPFLPSRPQAGNIPWVAISARQGTKFSKFTSRFKDDVYATTANSRRYCWILYAPIWLHRVSLSLCTLPGMSSLFCLSNSVHSHRQLDIYASDLLV